MKKFGLAAILMALTVSSANAQYIEYIKPRPIQPIPMTPLDTSPIGQVRQFGFQPASTPQVQPIDMSPLGISPAGIMQVNMLQVQTYGYQSQPSTYDRSSYSFDMNESRRLRMVEKSLQLEEKRLRQEAEHRKWQKEFSEKQAKEARGREMDRQNLMYYGTRTRMCALQMQIGLGYGRPGEKWCD